MFYLRCVAFGIWENDHPDWLEGDDVVGDQISDLGTISNKLSFWKIDADQSNLDLVIAAIAASFTRVSGLEYVLIKEEDLANRFSIVQSMGSTSIEEVNQLHCDLENLSGKSLIELARIIRAAMFDDHLNGGLIQPQLHHLLAKAVKNGKLSLEDIYLRKEFRNSVREILGIHN